jgi:hypothetical protein
VFVWFFSGFGVPGMPALVQGLFTAGCGSSAGALMHDPSVGLSAARHINSLRGVTQGAVAWSPGIALVAGPVCASLGQLPSCLLLCMVAACGPVCLVSVCCCGLRICVCLCHLLFLSCSCGDGLAIVAPAQTTNPAAVVGSAADTRALAAPALVYGLSCVLCAVCFVSIYMLRCVAAVSAAGPATKCRVALCVLPFASVCVVCGVLLAVR